jgi:hypothetical protein
MKGFRSHHHSPSLDFSWRNVRKPAQVQTIALQQLAPLFDHLIGAAKQRGRHVDTHRRRAPGQPKPFPSSCLLTNLLITEQTSHARSRTARARLVGRLRAASTGTIGTYGDALCTADDCLPVHPDCYPQASVYSP